MATRHFWITRRRVMERRVLSAVLTAIAGLSLLATARAQTSGEAQARADVSPWHFRADWTAGYSSWMSFPLPQDVGYDPSIYTEAQGSRTVLVRTFLAHGEKTAWFGFVRPLEFQAGPQTSCEIEYELQAAGAMNEVTLTLGAADGHHYSALLPSGTGQHRRSRYRRPRRDPASPQVSGLLRC